MCSPITGSSTCLHLQLRQAHAHLSQSSETFAPIPESADPGASLWHRAVSTPIRPQWQTLRPEYSQSRSVGLPLPPRSTSPWAEVVSAIGCRELRRPAL